MEAIPDDLRPDLGEFGDLVASGLGVLAVGRAAASGADVGPDLDDTGQPLGRDQLAHVTLVAGLADRWGRANLVAYIDGELPDATSRVLSTKLTHSATARQEVEILKKTWELLGHLPLPAVDLGPLGIPNVKIGLDSATVTAGPAALAVAGGIKVNSSAAK